MRNLRLWTQQTFSHTVKVIFLFCPFYLCGKLLLASLHHFHIVTAHAKFIPVPVHALQKHFAIFLALRCSGLGTLHRGSSKSLRLNGSRISTSAKKTRDHSTGNMSLERKYVKNKNYRHVQQPHLQQWWLFETLFLVAEVRPLVAAELLPEVLELAELLLSRSAFAAA